MAYWRPPFLNSMEVCDSRLHWWSGLRVKNRSGKRDFKYKGERDNAFLRGRDVGIIRYSMAGYRITVSCTRETLSQGRMLISQGDVGHSVGDADVEDKYESSSSAEEKGFQEDVPNPLLWVKKQTSFLVHYQHSVELFGSITGLCFNEILK